MTPEARSSARLPTSARSETSAAWRSASICATAEEVMEAIWVAAEMRAGAAYAHSAIALDEHGNLVVRVHHRQVLGLVHVQLEHIGRIGELCRGALGHPPTPTARTEPAPMTRKRDEAVEATVADYWSMLLSELRNEPYNKAEHNRRLQRLLSSRTNGAIERKHQNISAVLLYEHDLPYIDGYKPLRNVQGLLREVVQEWVSRSIELKQLVEALSVAPATVPTVDDILKALEEPLRSAAPNSPRS